MAIVVSKHLIIILKSMLSRKKYWDYIVLIKHKKIRNTKKEKKNHAPL